MEKIPKAVEERGESSCPGRDTMTLNVEWSAVLNTHDLDMGGVGQAFKRGAPSQVGRMALLALRPPHNFGFTAGSNRTGTCC